MGERSCEEFSFLSAGSFAIAPNMSANPNAAHNLNTGLFRLGLRGRLHKDLRLFRIYSASTYIICPIDNPSKQANIQSNADTAVHNPDAVDGCRSGGGARILRLHGFRYGDGANIVR